MRSQNDKLRLNMKAMMKAGGDETKILEQQNFELQQENNQLKDELAVTNQTHVGLVSEISMVRKEIQLMRDSSKNYVDENSKLASEILGLQQALEEKRSINSELLGKNSAFQTEISELHRRNSSEVQRHESAMEENSTSYEARIKGKDEQIQSLSTKVNNLSDEIVQLKYDLETRISLNMKTEQSKNDEISRVEKIMADATKHNTRLLDESKEALSLAYESILRLNREKDEVSIKLKLLEESSSPQNRLVTAANEDKVVSIVSTVSNDDASLLSRKRSESSDVLADAYDHEETECLSDVPAEKIPSAAALAVDATMTSDTSARQEMYQNYLDKRLEYALVLESTSGADTMRENTSNARYETLRNAIELSTASLKLVAREDMLLRDYLNQDNIEVASSLAFRDEKIINLEILTKTLCDTQGTVQSEAAEDQVKILALQKSIGELQGQLHECKLELADMSATSKAQKYRIAELENDIETRALFTSDARNQIDKINHQVEFLVKEKEEMSKMLEIAYQDNADIEARYDRLHHQASVIEEERNDLVQHFLNIGATTEQM